MKIGVWVVSVLLALAFLATGLMKVLTPGAELAAQSPVPVAALRTAGTAEVLGAIGLILPAATRILPILTPLAAAGLTLTMIMATIVNFATGYAEAAPVTIVLGLVSAFVLWARVKKVPVAPRSAA